MKSFIIFAIVLCLTQLCFGDNAYGYGVTRRRGPRGGGRRYGGGGGKRVQLPVLTKLRPPLVINTGGYGGGKQRGRGYGRAVPLNLPSYSLPLPSPNLIFRGRSYGSGKLGGGYGGGLALGGGGKGLAVSGGGYGGASGLRLQKGSDSIYGGAVTYEKVYDSDDSYSPLVPISGEEYVEEYRDGEVISCEEYDGGYEFERRPLY